MTRRAAGSRRLWRDCVFDTVVVDEGQDFGRYEWKYGIQALADGYAGKTCDYGAVAAGIADGTVKIVVCGDGGNGKLKCHGSGKQKCYGGGIQKSHARSGTGEKS